MSPVSAAHSQINPYSYYGQPLSGRLSVPVMASQSLYAQFQYVQGIPSADGGLSLDRLKVIDSLLAQINAHRQAGTTPVKKEDLNLAQPDETIAKLSAQAHEMQKQAGPFASWGQAKGLIFDLSA